MIKGIHHVSMKGSKEEFEAAKEFYGNVLGMKAVHDSGTGIMYDTGAGLIELGMTEDGRLSQGAVRHYALLCEDVDACVKKVKDAGYEVFMEPRDIEIKSDPVFPARIAFCYGPMGEEIEFFFEK